MEFKVYTNKKKPVFLYIHGEYLSTFSFRIQIKELKKDFQLILPVLDSSYEFESIEKSATQIIEFIDHNYRGHINVLSGFSLGGQIAVEILKKRPDFCDNAIIESTLLKPVKIKKWYELASVYMNSFFKNKLMNSFLYYARFNNEHAKEDYYKNYLKIDKDTAKKMYKAVYNYQLPDNLLECKARMAIIVGQREAKNVKQSANMLHEVVRKSEIFMLMNYTHGDFSLGYPNEYIRFVKSWIQNKDRQQRKKHKEIQEGEYMPNWKHLVNKWKSRKKNGSASIN